MNLRAAAFINLDAINQNLLNVRARLPQKCELFAVIKADGYGHGAVRIAKRVENTVDRFAVATIDEALEIRKVTKKPILILGFLHHDFYESAIENHVTLTIFSFGDAAALNEAAKKCGEKVKVHIKLDTGMGRIGFLPSDESIGEIKKIKDLENIEVEGIFTHFATADEADKAYTLLQKERFDTFYESLKAAGVIIPVRHTANSAGIMEFEGFPYEAARSGIVTYGLYPSGEVKKENLSLTPAMTFKSFIAHIKTVEKGDGVSYGKTFVAENEMKIATIPVGYADGYPRLLSNRGRIIAGGEYAKVVGRVCMDQFMVDVTGIENLKVGDEVTLMGKCGNKEVSCEEIAALANTINYEIVCGISKRVPRIYE